jgi:UrcA family protein
MFGNGVSRSCLLKSAAVLVCAYGNFMTVGIAAQSETDPPQLRVRIGDLNLNDRKGIAVAYGRIEWAAQRVCPLADSSEYWLRVSAEPCVTQAISRAIDTIGSPELAAYAQSRWLFRLQEIRNRAR